MEKQRKNYLFCKLLNPIILFIGWIGVLIVIAFIPPKVSEWKEVIVMSRSELIVPSGLGSETEITLTFSDKSTWKGYPSSATESERHLLYAKKGDIVCYRYNSHYFSGKQWRQP